MLLRIIILVVTSYCCIFKIYAQNNSIPAYSNELIESISTSEKWQKLIKLTPSSDSENSNFVIHSQRFYFSELSSLTAKKELINTLNAFTLAGNEKTIAENPQCRFPARYHWLKKKFDLSNVKAVVCDDFLAWSKLSSTQSLSLIFATGYLGNPASYYGHTLLKLNTNKSQKLNLLETSVNFGAKVPKNEDPISYMLKGVVGGYDGSFSHSNYYFHTQNYLENELRDLWEYKLNLSQDDYYFLVAHIWELIEQDYVYYFFDENCVYRMYELFTLFDDIELPSIKAPWVIPQEVIRAINSATYKDKPLVTKIKYIPSRQSSFYNKYWQLTSNEKLLIAKIVENTKQLNLLNSEKILRETKLKVLSTLLDYYQYLISVDKENIKRHKKSYTQILAYRYNLAAGKVKFEDKAPKSPHLARPSSYLQLGFIHNQKLGNGVAIKLRPAYYDQLDAESGHVRNGALKMGELDLEYINSTLAIRSLSIFEVVSVSNQATGLPQDGYDSWKLYLGLKKQDDDCTNCADFTFKANKGLSIPILDNTTIGGYIGGAVVENYLDRGRVYISSNLTLNQSINNDWNFFIDLEARKYLENEQVAKFSVKAETRYRVKLNNEHLDFRLILSNHETMLSLGYYW
ncbi:hypothetical protein DBO93_18535 [Colwellia sp. Arc7-D]|nr:hypothetical protein DBO93_18535 [Colwellia sp. Arc7-D]